MDKRTFFDNLHKQLAEKYQLTPHYVDTIRSFAVSREKSRKEIGEWCALKLSQPKRDTGDSRIDHRTQPKKHYQDILNFIASCSSEAWNDITQLTEMDTTHNIGS